LKRLNIQTIRPSINKCFAEFKAVNGKLFYGLGAIKSVGFEAISNIINEREKNGKYTSFIDFINRVDAKDVNKLQLEGLVKAGVFDEFDKDRYKILNSIPKIIQQIKNINEDKNNNQSNLFDMNIDSKKDFDFLPSKPWKQKELLTEEFKALGFYLSDHPLNEYEEAFNQLKIIPYNQFYNNQDNEGLVAGTIMSVQEKKSAKGTPYGIVKFSDKKGEFELFLFAEILISNREKLKESESFVLTLQKDKISGENLKKRINVRKITSLDEVINKPYSKVTIELKQNYDLDEIHELLSVNGDTEINFIIKDQNKQAHYSLQNNRKFDLKDLKALKAKKYVEKITV
jgi:DNA polymerase-3 subunit alpha